MHMINTHLMLFLLYIWYIDGVQFHSVSYGMLVAIRLIVKKYRVLNPGQFFTLQAISSTLIHILRITDIHSMDF